MSSDQDEISAEIPDDQADAFNDQEGKDNRDAGITAEEEEEGQWQQQLLQQQLRPQEDNELQISLLALDPASLLSKDSGQNYFSEAPPPSPEKTRRQRPTRRTTRPDNNADAAARALVSEDVSRRSGIELEVEELLDNSNQWRKAFQPRIRTPVRRAVLSYGGVSPGRRQQVLCDLNAKVRELEVASLSRGIACSLQVTAGGQQQSRHQQQRGGELEDSAPAAHVIGSASKLDPRVRIAYQHMKPRQSDESSPSKYDSRLSSWHDAGRLQSRRHSVRSRATVNSHNTGADVRTAAGTTAGSGSRPPPRRVKTSPTTLTAPLAASSCWPNCVTKADLLRLQTINGEVQRSLYTERTPGLRRLLHAGDGDSGVGGLYGSSLQTIPLARLLTEDRGTSSTAGPSARRLQPRV